MYLLLLARDRNVRYSPGIRHAEKLTISFPRKIFKKVIKVKFFHSLIAEGAVMVRDPLCLGHRTLKAEPGPILSLSNHSLI